MTGNFAPTAAGSVPTPLIYQEVSTCDQYWRLIHGFNKKLSCNMHANCLTPKPQGFIFISPSDIFFNTQQACLNHPDTGIEFLIILCYASVL